MQQRADLAGLETRRGVGAIGDARPRREYLLSTGNALPPNVSATTTARASCPSLIGASNAVIALTPRQTPRDTASEALKSP
jgi:hypothetical protein